MVDVKPLRFAIAALLLLVGTRSFACDTIPIPPTDLDPNEVVFIGAVADIADPGTENDQSAPARVKVRVRKSLQASAGKNVKEYTLLLYGLGADCSKTPMSRSRVIEIFPPGTEVWVIGTVGPQDSGVVEVQFGVTGNIVENKADERVNLRSRYDYCPERSFGPNPIKLEFELRKDLARLRQAASDVERARILKRLAFHPWYRGWYSPGQFEKLVDQHLDDQALIQDVMSFREKRIKDRIAPVCGAIV